MIHNHYYTYDYLSKHKHLTEFIFYDSLFTTFLVVEFEFANKK